MSSEKYTVEVLVNGKPVKKYNHQSKVYIEGRSGTEYSLRLRNNSFDRVLAIISVDGVNVITGQVASENDTGYIIDPNSSIDVSGFRKDKNTVGSFVFCGKNESYSKDVGLKNNQGVIGVVFIREKESAIDKLGNKLKEIVKDCENSKPLTPVYPPYYPPYTPPTSPYRPPMWYDTVTTCSNNSNTISSLNNEVQTSCFRSIAPQQETPDFNLGTTWGSKKFDSVDYMEFERGPRVGEIAIYYSTRKALEKIGISFKEVKGIAKFPDPFPKFATPPKHWQG